MSQLPVNLQPAESNPSRRSTILPAVINIGCSLPLLIGSLFAALTTCGFNLNGAKNENSFLFVGLGGFAIVSFVVFISAIVWFAIAVIIWMVRNSGSEL